jgi:hypothetical protein
MTGYSALQAENVLMAKQTTVEIFSCQIFVFFQRHNAAFLPLLLLKTAFLGSWIRLSLAEFFPLTVRLEVPSLSFLLFSHSPFSFFLRV